MNWPTVQQFDPTLGALQSVDIAYSSAVSSEVALTNYSSQTQRFLYSSSTELTVTSVAAGFADTFAYTLFAVPLTLIAADATLTPTPVHLTEGREATLLSNTALSAFSGAGTISFEAQSSTSQSITGGGGNVNAQQSTMAGVAITVTYTYITPLTQAAPAAPALSTPPCGAEATVIIPAVEGVAYTQVRNGSTVTVTATAQAGYVLAEGAQTTWQLTIPAVVACPSPTTPLAPTLTAPACGTEATAIIPTVQGVAYAQVRNGSTVTVTATAQAGYVLAEGTQATWQLTIPAVVACPGTGSLAATGASASTGVTAGATLALVGTMLLGLGLTRRRQS